MAWGLRLEKESWWASVRFFIRCVTCCASDFDFSRLPCSSFSFFVNNTIMQCCFKALYFLHKTKCEKRGLICASNEAKVTQLNNMYLPLVE